MLAQYTRKLVPSKNDAAHATGGRGGGGGSAPVEPRAQAQLTFREYEPADQATAIQLLSQGRPPMYRRAKRAIFDWQCDLNPHQDGRPPYLIGTVERRDGVPEIVATNGFMPVKIRYQGASLQSSWSCDTFVSSKFRGCGFGSALIRRVSEHSPVMLGYGISDMSDPIFERQGWALHPGVSLLFLHVAEPGLKGALKQACSRVVAQLRSLRSSSSGLDIAERDEDFGPDVDALWHRSAPTYFSTVERDAAYLNWKYRRHPYQRYSWFGAYEGGTLRGLVVARHNRESSVIVDYCGPANDHALMNDLVHAAVVRMAEQGTMRVRCETTHSPMLSALRRMGFIGSRYRPHFRVRTNIPGDVRPLERWFLMPGDSDGDLLATYEPPPVSLRSSRSSVSAPEARSARLGTHLRPHTGR